MSIDRAKLEEIAAAAGARARAVLERAWWPSVLLALAAVYVIGRSLLDHNYALQAYWTHDAALSALSWACWALAAAGVIHPPIRRWLAHHLDRLSTAPLKEHLFWVGGAFLAITAWLGFIRYCQYRSFLLPQDTANSINIAYNFIKHGSLYYTIVGVHQFSAHFFVLMAVFSPVLLIWNSPLALLAVQHLFVCSAPLAVYALTYVLTASSLAGFIGLLLSFSSPYFFEHLTANLAYSSLIAFLPWAVFFIHQKRRWWAALFILLMLCTSEQVPFIFFGVGLYIAARGWRQPRRWLLAALVCAASAGLWFAEMALIRHYAALEPVKEYAGSNYWALFGNLVPSDTPTGSIFSEIVRHPWRTLTAAGSSFYRFYPVLRLLFFAGFFGFLSPATMLPFLITALPHILANPGSPMRFLDVTLSNYIDFGMHQSAYVFGPLLWALAAGLGAAWAYFRVRGRRWLLVWALVVSGFGFRHAHRTLNANFRNSWFDAMPRALARIPRGARVWVDEYASPQLSCRKWLKIMQWGPGEPQGYQSLFKPDYVLFDYAFLVQALPPYRDKVLTYLARSGYRKVAEDAPLILLKAPADSALPDDAAESIKLPEADLKTAQLYTQKLLRRLDGKGRLDDQSLDIFNDEALALAAQGHWDAAIVHYKEILRLNPKYFKSHVNLGVALAAQGRKQEAAAAFEEAMRLNPRHSEARSYYGNFLANAGGFEEAVVQYRLALALDPKNQAAVRNLAQAERLLQAVLERDKQDEARLDRFNDDALSLAAQGNWEQAIARYQDILAINPRFFKAHNNLAVALAARGQDQEAYVHFVRAAQLSPRTPGVRVYFGNFLATRGKLKEAAEQYHEALKLDAGNAEARENLAKVQEYLASQKAAHP